MSIYCGAKRTQPDQRQSAALRLTRTLAFALFQLALTAAVGASPTTACSDGLYAASPHFQAQLRTVGTRPAELRIPLQPGHEWLIEAHERGNDALLEIRDSTGRMLAQADHPERRTGTRRAIVSTSSDLPSIVLRVSGKEHDAVHGTVDIAVVDLAALSKNPACLSAFRSLAAGDADYAIAQQISLARTPMTGATQTAREAYLRAAEEYATAQATLGGTGDATLRAELALAIAGVRYFDLQDWRGSAQWATEAGKLFEHDAYRRARAEALAAAAWIEIATESRPGIATAGESDPKALFGRARRTLRDLYLFHDRRHEPYDAALQMNNIGLAFMYEGRFHECIATARTASRLFARIGETPRQALAWQNRAVCHWGLGHLPEALRAFNRALRDMKPEPYPQLYLLTLNNTALINYALGHFDDSLRLHDQALELATRSQNRREEAQSLYGIGVTYYALGDRMQAREFLERSLAIRTTAFDGRGRRATLRSLATLYADLGEFHKAIEFDREALSLATAPTSRARSRIQLAVHSALDGNPQVALDILAEIIDPDNVPDPLVRAQARVQRAVIKRQSGDYQESLNDLGSAIPVFQSLGAVTDGFYADLERARSLKLTGNQSAALVAVDQALARSEFIRTQTANPEFRAQLQLPLRAAYDLKLDLLWEKFDSAVKAGLEHEAAGIAATAFHSADSARARSFADVSAQQYSPARGDLAADLIRREALYRNLAGLRFALDFRLDHAESTDLRARNFQSEIAGLQRQLDTLNNAIASRAATGHSSAFAHGASASMESMALPADAAIAAYWLGAHDAYAWAVNPAGIHWVRLSDSITITNAARVFHDSLVRLADVPRERRLESGSVLYDEIIRPVEPWLAPYQRWYVIADAALNYVPFAALRENRDDGPRYVVAAHDVASAPAAWLLLAPPPRSEPSRAALPDRHARILLVSDPVYERSDPRLPPEESPRAAGDLPTPSRRDRERRYQRIPGTAREAAGIRAQFTAGDVDSFTGFDASRDRLLQLDWSQYRFIHIASHGHVDAQMPQLSALMLSAYDRRAEPIEAALRSADVSSLNLAADVAVFSGCDTALGKEVLNEGMVGIAYVALARGAGAVVSSLWQVPDETGSDLMTDFYRHMLRDSMSPVTALSASMRSVLKRNPSADPALWAAFHVSVAGVAARHQWNEGLP